jgi:hypothetical protein
LEPLPVAAAKVIWGLLEICRYAMPDTYWQSDSRINAARKYLGKAMPTDEVLAINFDRRLH